MKGQIAAPWQHTVNTPVTMFDSFRYAVMQVMDNIMVNYFARTVASTEVNWFMLLYVLFNQVIKPALLRIHCQMQIIKSAVIKSIQAWAGHYGNGKQFCCD